MKRRCILLLGGSFDPVHCGHVALARYFADIIRPDELRILPAGNPWQKAALGASGAQRVAMLERAFEQQDVPVVIDQRELQNPNPTYTINTLRSLRAELGREVSLVFLMGADQLQRLDTWKEWHQLFDFAHVCAAARPGFTLDGQQVPAEIRQVIEQRASTLAQIRDTPQGMTFLAPNLAVDISATEIRSALLRGEQPDTLIPLVPHAVLDYIQQHHLYKS